MKLTLPQQDVYFEQMLYPNDPIYNIGAKIEIRGIIDCQVLNEAYVKLIDQHDAYRSIIVSDSLGVKIEILPKHNSVLGFRDFSNSENPDDIANDFMIAKFSDTFDLAKKKLLHESILIKVRDDFYYLFSMYHHIITDGWGTSLMFQRLVANYNELLYHGKVISEYPYTYQDFVAYDNEYSISKDHKTDQEYWTTKFNQLPERMFERIDKNVHSNKSGRKELFIKRIIYNKLEEVAKELKSSTFHVILGLLYTYFGRKYQNDDFAIGLPVLNRGKFVFKKTVGLFMVVSPLRMTLDFEDTFEELSQKIKKQLRMDYRHQRFPLGKLIEEMSIFQDKDRLFNLTLSYEKQNYADHFADTDTRVVPLTHQSERVALALYIREFDETQDVKIDFDYNFNYFDDFHIDQVVKHFEVLLMEIIINPRKKLLEYSFMTEPEQNQLLNTFNQTFFKYPKEKTILEFFKTQVKYHPNKIAIKDTKLSYSYYRLNNISDRIAYGLQQKLSDKNKAPIAIFTRRSADLVAIMLGILKSGHPFIPLDPDFPKERLKYIISNSQVQAIVGYPRLKLEGLNEITFLDEAALIDTNLDTFSTLPKINSNDTAYIIYTSGSAGNPKGVEIGHKSLLNILLSIQNKPGINDKDIFYSVTTPSFDISILEFFAPLISGAKLYIANQETLKDPLKVINSLKKLHPTIIQATPSFYQMLYNAGWKGDRNMKVLCGGDLLSEALAEKLVNTSAQLWSMYGPTETTIWSSQKQILNASEASNIGKPISNTSLYILDSNLNLVPIGSTGKIYIGGDGLAKGYYNNPSLTAENFITSPFGADELIYQTGDLGKWNLNGEVIFLGRNDLQVKIRGYRIELGEIEARLDAMETIASSVVVANKKNDGEAFLIAYVIPNTKTYNDFDIINALRRELPEYMMPQTIIPIESFPLTHNNKVNRKALLLQSNRLYSHSSEYPKPQNSTRTRNRTVQLLSRNT